MQSMDFLTEIENDVSTDSENDNIEPKVSKKPILIPAKEEFKSKFEYLKTKNARIKQRLEKRKLKKDKKREEAKESKIAENYVKNQNSPSNIKLKPILLTGDESEKDIKILQKQIDKALSDSNIELAEKLSDNLFQEQAKASLNKQIELEKYISNTANKRKLEPKKPKYNWRFEAKKKWETKLNT